MFHLPCYYKITPHNKRWRFYMNILFFFNSVLLGVGLAMDAFSVSLANGLCDPKMSKKRTYIIAGTYAFFQFLMPMIGWLCVHTFVERFTQFQKFIPWIALILLCFIGGKMIIEGFHKVHEDIDCCIRLSATTLLMQGIATSIDALSVGFTISGYGFIPAFIESLIIAAVTMVICIIGLKLGKKASNKLSCKADLLGGFILIFIGLEIFLT